MDGDFAPMPKLVELRKKHGFLLVIDDVSLTFSSNWCFTVIYKIYILCKLASGSCNTCMWWEWWWNPGSLSVWKWCWCMHRHSEQGCRLSGWFYCLQVNNACCNDKVSKLTMDYSEDIFLINCYLFVLVFAKFDIKRLFVSMHWKKFLYLHFWE